MKTKDKIYILTEAGSKFGYGHLTRCSALYDEAVNLGIEAKLFVDADCEIKEILEHRKHEVLDWRNKTSLLDFQGVYAIVDSYHADEYLCKYICDNAKATLFLDDFARIDYPGGIVVNPALMVPEDFYAQHKKATYVFGKDFVILREPFREQYCKHVSEQVKNILISLGGSDFSELVGTILAAVNMSELTDAQINLVITSNYRNTDLYYQLIDEKKRNHLSLNQNLSADEMCGLIVESDFAIIGGGQTINELISMTTPFICLKCASNQENNTRAIKDLQIVEDCIDIIENENLKIAQLTESINKMLDLKQRKKLIGNMEKIDVKKGCSLIIDRLLKK